MTQTTGPNFLKTISTSTTKQLLNSDATKANIMEGLKGLLVGAKAGDVLVFTNASHGTYDADTDGDEDKFDEAICPHDTNSRAFYLRGRRRNLVC